MARRAAHRKRARCAAPADGRGAQAQHVRAWNARRDGFANGSYGRPAHGGFGARRREGITKPTLDEAIALTAIFPTIVGATWRRRQGGDVVEPRDDLGHAGNLLWTMEGKEPDPERARWVDAYLLLLADHGLNASTFAARVVASTGSDLTSCVVGAIAALKGPAHGGA